MIDTSKYLNKIKNKKTKPKKNKFIGYINKILVLVVLFLINLILIKSNNNYKDFIYEKIYNNNISFTKIKNFYNKYLGGVEALDGLVNNTEEVFNETLTYTNENKYYDGVKLEVSNNYLVPALSSGMVVFIGEKENYGNVIIVEGMDNINIWYGNISNTSLKLYDYLDEGSLIGETLNNNLYLIYEQEGKFLNYEEYLK